MANQSPAGSTCSSPVLRLMPAGIMAAVITLPTLAACMMVAGLISGVIPPNIVMPGVVMVLTVIVMIIVMMIAWTMISTAST